MPVSIDGREYVPISELQRRLNVSRQTLWRWRQQRKIPSGHRYRGRDVVFSPEEVAAIEEFANRIEPINAVTDNQLNLFESRRSYERG